MAYNKRHVAHQLSLAEAFIELGLYREALGCLIVARNEARQGKGVKAKLIATHCTGAIQAIMPYLLEGRI